jgi:hypothetical protein
MLSLRVSTKILCRIHHRVAEGTDSMKYQCHSRLGYITIMFIIQHPRSSCPFVSTKYRWSVRKMGNTQNQLNW